MMKNKKIKLISSLAVAFAIILGVIVGYKETGKIDKNEIYKAVDIVTDNIEQYNMTDEEIKELPSTEIQEQTEEQEKATEQATTETEGFELQGDIAYNGDNEFPNVKLGDYAGLTYYSQIDNRWRNETYTSVGNNGQTIGTSGCGPTSGAMVVTAIKGVITPKEMADLYVKYGYRSSNNGTYFSAFRWTADTFNIGYKETYKLDEAVDLVKNNNYIIVSCGNGLFTTGGHFIVIVGIEGDTLKIYDPYLYAGKFETITRRGKVTVNGNTVYCTIDNFRNYANYQKFFAFQGESNKQINDYKPVVTSTYTRYVKANGGLRIRNNPNGNIVGLLQTRSKVTVYETKNNWSKIGDNKWVCSDYLVSTSQTVQKLNGTAGQTKKLTRASILYSNSNLTGYTYNYKANTTITILQNINANVDRVRINVTGRIAYINNSNYSNITISSARGTVGKTKKTKSCILYRNSNLSGIRYNYKANTTVTILQNVNSYIDKVRVNANGRIAYINVNSYR